MKKMRRRDDREFKISIVSELESDKLPAQVFEELEKEGRIKRTIGKHGEVISLKV